jgi:phage gp29-like protein
MIEWCERTQSKVILGATLTSDTGKSGGGSFALGKVHDSVRHDILGSDARQIQSTLTHGLIKLIANINGLLVDDSRYPSFEFDIFEAVDIAEYADALPKLVGVGVPIPVSYIQDKLRIPAPKEGEAVLQVASVASNQQAALADNRLSKPRFTADQQVIEDGVTSVLSGVVSPISAADILTVSLAARGPEDLADRLAVLMGSDASEFEQALAKAMFLADCFGYASESKA